MGQLVFQATLGGQVNLVGPNTASTFNLNVPAVNSTIASLAAQTFAGTQTFTVDSVVNGLTVGKGAGSVATNTAVGASALALNSSGVNATAVGYQAGYSSTGGYLTAFGYNAGYSVTSGTDDVFVGWNTGFATTTGSSNVAMGDNAFRNNTTGGNSVSLGHAALYSNTTASNNTAVGYQAAYSQQTGIDTVAVGYRALYTATGLRNTAIGKEALYSLTTGTNNTAIGESSGYSMTTGSKNTIIGSYSGNQGGLDIRTASNYIVLSDGDGNPRQWFNSTGVLYSPGVYAATGGSAANVVVDSSGTIYRSTSALKYKQDIRDLENIDINIFRPVRYKSKCERDDPTQDHFGIIADEVDAAGIKELVSYNADGEVEGFQYERLTVVLLKKLQVLESEFKAYVATHP